MIDYDPHRWWFHFFDIKGSMVKEIAARVSSCTLWAVAVVIIDQHIMDVSISPIAHQLVGTALGLLLVFRTNSSYDRFWEGRRMWGSIINESRNLVRGAAAHLHEAPDLRRRVAVLSIALAYSIMARLRGQKGLGEAEKLLPSNEIADILATHNPRIEIAARITRTLCEARDRGVISDFVLVHIDQNTQQLIDYMGACERIQNTPLPFAYMVHLRRVLVLYCFTLPFALINTFEWATVPNTFLVAYTFFGIEEIGVEIEEPFGMDENDLPLERFCALIEADELGAIGERKPAA